MNTRPLLSSLCALVALTFASCRPDGVDGEVLMTFTDLATYEGDTAPGGHAAFSVIRDGDQPAAQLYSDITLADRQPEGTRMLISYTTPTNLPYTTGPVSIISGYAVNQGPAVTEWRDEYRRWDADPVWLNSVWRTGRFVNFNVRLAYSTRPRIFTLVAAEGWESQQWPDLYLAHALPPDVGDTHDRRYYASYDISAIWDRPAVQGVRVHVATDNLGGIKVFEFAKTASSQSAE